MPSSRATSKSLCEVPAMHRTVCVLLQDAPCTVHGRHLIVQMNPVSNALNPSRNDQVGHAELDRQSLEKFGCPW
jgi:hypothetical protein